MRPPLSIELRCNQPIRSLGFHLTHNSYEIFSHNVMLTLCRNNTSLDSLSHKYFGRRNYRKYITNYSENKGNLNLIFAAGSNKKGGWRYTAPFWLHDFISCYVYTRRLVIDVTGHDCIQRHSEEVRLSYT